MSGSFSRARRSVLSPLRPALVATALALAATTPLWAGNITLNETGSTLLYPLFTQWIQDYAKIAPDVHLTAASTGSGAGIDAALSGKAQIGASDAYMSDEQHAQHPAIVNIPVAISAVGVNYNIPGLNKAGLKLDGPTLAGIYTGKITTWDAPPIAALNPGVQMPHQAIVPIRRQDGSGDTFVFTQFLDFSTQTWENKIGYGTSIKWPAVAGERSAPGNEGVLKAATTTPYSVAYIGVSYRDAIAKAGLGTAVLKNENGKFVLPTADTINAAAAALDQRTPPDERLTLAFAPGDDSYPLVNYEYLMVSTRQPDAQTAAALRQFLLWAVSLQGGNASRYLDSVGFIPLPDFIRALSEKQISLIKAAAAGKS